jgi:AcrR family transcriptional regulator
MPRPKKITDEAVLEAALRVMLRAGPEDFTLAAAAAEAGVSPATLIQRFGDKHTLIVRALAQDTAQYARMLEEAPVRVGREAVLDVFWLMTPDVDIEDPAALADQILWLREDFRDPQLRALAQERFRLLRRAIAERLPPLPVPPEVAARLIEAQWQGALNQWGFFPEGRLVDYVQHALNDWFDLAEGSGTGA